MNKTQLMVRRAFLKKAGRYLAAAPFITLAACNDDGSTVIASTGSDTTTDSSDSTTTTTSTSTSGSTDAASSWATGGTDSLTVAKSNPFASGAYSTCTVTKETTEGPCYSGTESREDISEGLDGLPVRLCLRVVDSDCNPLSGVVVDIWHCDTEGVYSGSDMQMVNFCTNGDSYYTSNNFYRGTRTTDSDGLVYFATNFPGWYSSRAVHIHFMVQNGNTTYVTSQFCFDDTLVTSILTAEPIYADRGDADTHNYDDTVFPSTGYEQYQLDYSRQSDGSMLAWKEIMLSNA